MNETLNELFNLKCRYIGRRFKHYKTKDIYCIEKVLVDTNNKCMYHSKYAFSYYKLGGARIDYVRNTDEFLELIPDKNGKTASSRFYEVED